MNTNDNQEEIPDSLSRYNLNKNYHHPDHYYSCMQDKVIAKIENLPLSELGIVHSNYFRIPANYFDNSRNQILSTLRLNQITNQNEFKVPDLYFNQMQEDVLYKIQKVNNKGILTKWIGKRLKIISIAAMFVLVMSVFLLRSPQINDIKTMNISEIDDETLLNFIAMNDVDLHNLTDEMDEVNFSDINIGNDDLDEESVKQLLNIYP